MKFRTELIPHQSELNITHNDPILMLGSCFTTTIGDKLTRLKFKTLVNPYGIIYHPQSILHNLTEALENQPTNPNLTVKLNNRYVHYSCHSDINAPDPVALINMIEETHRSLKSTISNFRVVVITLGSAFYFSHKELGIVANCHKQPNYLFDRHLSSAPGIISRLDAIVQLLRTHNPTCEIILTVSPVRHIRDGLIQNNRSKSHLLTAVHKAVETFDRVYYFPSYELILDDLRDYRFFKEDLIHPSEQAITYVWDFFCKTFFKEKTRILNKRIHKLISTLEHRPIDPGSASHFETIRKVKEELKVIQEEYQLDFSNELA